MRRGHPGIGGWRSENPRHFRSRGSGPPRFRPPRIYPLIETPRFPPPSTRLHHRGPQPFIGHANHPEDHGRQDHHDRHKYRDDHHQINQRMSERGHHSRQAFPYMHHNVRQTENNQCSQYNNSNFYDDIQTEPYQVNSMGDIDHRQTPHMQHAQESYNQQRISQWSNPPPEIKKHYYEHRSPQKSFRHHDASEANRIPLLDYTGHRPPSSDHYGGTTGPTTNNNDTSFSRSVDDTVDIIRKRLMNRSDPSRLSQDASIQENLNSEQEVHEISHQHTQQEQPAKKRTPRQRNNDKTNCAKMKTNIVHQLFKMDKDKMHKLMDDPSSSSKFEYAISSLITESQNSLNRHLRAVAEKSLHHSSTDFIQNDNNTIYEDIFMKQMQCILDPQDTVLLEDIKPIVMAELSKVLQLDELEQRYDMTDEHNNQHTRDDQSNYQYFQPYNYDEYAHTTNYEQVPSSSSNLDDTNRVDVTGGTNINYDYNNETAHEETKLLFERRQQKRTEPSENRRHSIERQRRRKEQPAEEVYKAEVELPSFFDSNTDQLSEVDDTFAELDRQYHVAVDPNFIENDDLTARGTPPILQSIPESPHIKREINDQLQNVVKSPLNLFPVNSSIDQLRDIAVQIKKELSQSSHIPYDHATVTSCNKDTHHVGRLETRQEYAPKSKGTDKETEKSGSSNTIKISPSNSRKRSIDQRPPHRKEKRKKRDSSSSSHYDSVKQTADKKSLTHVYNSKSSEKCNDAPKPYNNILLHRDESTKESKDDRKSYSANRRYSDKYVKRKEPSKRSKDKECESGRKRHSSTSSQSILSPKDNNNTTSQTPTKTDPKTKLKTFDMFVEQPKKSVMPHQAHRNTAAAVTPTKPTVEENNPQLVPTAAHNVQTKHVGTQVIKRLITKETQTSLSKSCSTRFCQTDRKKFITKMVQTSPVSLGNSKPKATDAFERMKEIDMEIQVLLQEKFKLYSSLEAKDSCPSSMPTLGMTVLNVTPVDETETKDDIAAPVPENIMNADEIIDDFTSIPVEELEEIALESVTVHEESSADSAKIEKRSLRQKVLQQERKTSESPTSRKRNNKKVKPPNISLIEQIITDDRPLEDIISLDDLEAPLTRNRKKPNIKQDTRKSHTKKKTKRTKPAATSIDISSYGLKNCLVVLDPNDVKKFIKESSPMSDNIVKVTPGPSSADSVETVSTESLEKAITTQVGEVVNDLQFDMLDVSEDIVIGDNCEIKCNDDKDGPERVPISEDIILDNSQSSADEAISAEGAQAESECRTYDYSTDEKLRRDSITVTGNADAVLAIECIENDFIAACLDGNVYHFSGDGILLNTLRGSNLAVTCLTIVKEKYGTTVYTGSLDSRIRYYDLDSGFEKGPECNVLSPIQTMDRAWDTVFVGTRTGFVLQFECKNNMLIPVSTVKFSEQSILALRAMKEGPRKVLLVAARSENVTIKDAQTGLLLRTLSGPKMTVYTLLFEDGKVFCGTSSHQIHVFDYSSGMHTGCHEGGKGAVCLRASGGLLFAGCYDGCVYVYREGETRPLAQLRGPSLMLLSLAIVGSKIIAGYKDRSLYIWKIPLSILQEMIL